MKSGVLNARGKNVSVSFMNVRTRSATFFFFFFLLFFLFGQMTTHWYPSSILSKKIGNKFCLIILNQPITRMDIFHKLWDNGTWKESIVIAYIKSCHSLYKVSSRWRFE